MIIMKPREMDMIKISVIIPIYNVEKFLRRCIDSILTNLIDFFDAEIILIDDGSTDSSSIIADEYCEKDKRIKCIHKKNGGLSEARNIGIENASGDYFYFIDSDDYLVGPLFKRFKTALEKYPNLDIFHFNFIKVFEGSDKSISNDQKDYFEVLKTEEAYKEFLIGRKITRMAWDKIYKARIFNNIKFPEGMLAEDYGTTYKLIANAQQVVIDKTILYAYYQRTNSIMHSSGIKLIVDELSLGKNQKSFSLSRFPSLYFYINTVYVNLLIKTYYRLNIFPKNEQILTIMEQIKIELKLYGKTKIKITSQLMRYLLLYFPHLGGILMQSKFNMHN